MTDAVQDLPKDDIGRDLIDNLFAGIVSEVATRNDWYRATVYGPEPTAEAMGPLRP